MTADSVSSMMVVMDATLVIKKRIIYSSRELIEMVIWRLPAMPIRTTHPFKYRLAYVVDAKCVVRYDNEVRKGDHCHFGSIQTPYEFTTLNRLISDFYTDIGRWNDENSSI